MELFRRRGLKTEMEIEYEKARKLAQEYWERGSKFMDSQNIAGHLGLRGKEIEFTATIVGGKLLQRDIDLLDERLQGQDENRFKKSGIPFLIDPISRTAERRRMLRNGQRLYQVGLDEAFEVIQQDPVARNFCWVINNAINDLFCKIANNEPGRSSPQRSLSMDSMLDWSELWYQRLEAPIGNS